MSSSNIIAWKIKFLWTSESKRIYNLYFSCLVWTLTSRKIYSLNSALTTLSFNASEASKIKTNHFLTSSILNSLNCSSLFYHNFSSPEVSLQYFTSELYVTVKPLYLQICFLSHDISVFCHIWIIELQRQYYSSLILFY